MRPICVKCSRMFRPKKNGFHFIEGRPEGNARPGLADAEKWKPYKVWAGDLWECPGCALEIICGTGRSPIAEHYEPDFQRRVTQLGAEFQVNDC